MALRKLGFLNQNTTLFLLCDVQEKFRFMKSFPEFTKNVTRLVEAGKILNIPLVVTEQNPSRLGKTIAEINIDHALGNFSKTRFSMCISEVQEKLDSLKNIDSIVLFGLETHICVEQTSLDLLALEKYNVHVVADCVLSRSLEERLLALQRMRDSGCIITTAENVIFKLLRDANHEKFSEVRKLVTEPSASTGLCNKL